MKKQIKQPVFYHGVKNDLNTLMKFVYIFEKDIKLLNKENYFSIKYPEAFLIFKQKLQKVIKYSTQKELNEGAYIKNCQYTLYYTKQKFQVWDLCRHLRNAICHALIEKTEMNKYSVLKIPDYYKRKISSEGYLDYSIIKFFLVEIVKKYENTEISNQINNA